MADWNPPTDTEIDVLKPVKASNHRRIRDLATALAENASGAPKVQPKALRTIALFATSTDSSGVLGSWTAVTDTESILNTSTGAITMPIEGIVEVNFSVNGYLERGSASFTANLRKNSTVQLSKTTSANITSNNGGIMTLNDLQVIGNAIIIVSAGDILDITVSGNVEPGHSISLKYIGA